MSRIEMQKDQVVLQAMKTIYKLLATPEAQAVVEKLIDNGKMRSTELMNSAKLTESQFHPLVRQLVKNLVLEKSVDQNRGVSYDISRFGKYVLEVNKQLLKEVKRLNLENSLVTP